MTPIKALSVRERCSFVLAVVDKFPERLTNDPVGAALGRRGLRDAARWVAGEPVSPDALAAYVDSDGPDNLGLREGHQGDGAQLDAHVAITSAIMYVGWHAYNAAKRTDLSETMCEIGEHTVDDIVRFAKSSGFVGDRDVERAMERARSAGG